MHFEVEQKVRKHWRSRNLQEAQDSAQAATRTAKIYGPGTYRVRPEDSRDRFITYIVKPNTQSLTTPQARTTSGNSSQSSTGWDKIPQNSKCSGPNTGTDTDSQHTPETTKAQRPTSQE